MGDHLDVDVADFARQREYDIRFDWGAEGVAACAGDVVVVVDVLRFTTAVEAAAGHGLAVHPYRWKDSTAQSFAQSVGAVLADGREPSGPSLSYASLLALPSHGSVVLPSPNGATCALSAAETGATVTAACLRNARAVARWAASAGGSVTVIACGERWPDGSLRPAVEDLLGAGAVIASLTGHCSPEAEAAMGAFRGMATSLPVALRGCASGRELIEKGWLQDVDYAAAVDVSDVVPVMSRGVFVAT